MQFLLSSHLAEDGWGAMTKYEGETSSSNIKGVQLKISLKCIWSVADVEAKSLTMHDWLHSNGSR